jgi:hypothetical protein
LTFGGLAEPRLADLDTCLQRVLEISQNNSLVKTYRPEIRRLARKLQQLEKIALTTTVNWRNAEYESIACKQSNVRPFGEAA